MPLLSYYFLFVFILFRLVSHVSANDLKINTEEPTSLGLIWNPQSTPVLKKSLNQQSLHLFWEHTCANLAKGLVHGKGIFGTGPFTRVECDIEPKDTFEKNNWFLLLKEENNQLIFEVRFKKNIRASIFLISDVRNYEVLDQQQILDLITFGLIDQLPFLGYVNSKNVTVSEILLSRKTSSALTEFLPKKIIFYDLAPISNEYFLEAKVHLSVPSESNSSQYFVTSAAFARVLNLKSHAWFHNDSGIAKVSNKIQEKILNLQKEFISEQVERTSKYVVIKNFTLLRAGKQILTSGLELEKSWLLGFQLELGWQSISGLKMSFDYSPNSAADSALGSEKLQWQKFSLAKSFTKYFDNSAVDFTPGIRFSTYRSSLVNIEEGQEVGITNMDIKNATSAQLEVGLSKFFRQNWLRIYYISNLSFQTQPVTKISGQNLGLGYYLPFYTRQDNEALTGHLLLNFFTEYESLTFLIASEDDQPLSSKLQTATIFMGSGFGLFL